MMLNRIKIKKNQSRNQHWLKPATLNAARVIVAQRVLLVNLDVKEETALMACLVNQVIADLQHHQLQN